MGFAVRKLYVTIHAGNGKEGEYFQNKAVKMKSKCGFQTRFLIKHIHKSRTVGQGQQQKKSSLQNFKRYFSSDSLQRWG